MFYQGPKDPTTTVEVLGATYLIEHVPDVLTYHGDDMAPVMHPQRPRVWHVTAEGVSIVANIHVERAVLAEMAVKEEVSEDHSIFVRPAVAKRSSAIDKSFWDGVLLLQERGDLWRHGNEIHTRITKTEVAWQTAHFGREKSDQEALQNLKRNLEKNSLVFVKAT